MPQSAPAPLTIQPLPAERLQLQRLLASVLLSFGVHLLIMMALLSPLVPQVRKPVLTNQQAGITVRLAQGESDTSTTDGTPGTSSQSDRVAVPDTVDSQDDQPDRANPAPPPVPPSAPVALDPQQAPVLTARLVRTLRKQAPSIKVNAALDRYAQQVTELEARIVARSSQISPPPPPPPEPMADQRDPSAAYVRRFRQRVEQAGNRLYPAAALEQGITGQVRLAVIVDRTGRIRAIQLLRSSGSALLDQAAILSVERSAPFRPFDAEMQHLQEVRIVRTWRYDRSVTQAE